MITRRFEYTGGGSDKFWEVTFPDIAADRGVRSWQCRWGRRGTDGQSKTFTAGCQSAAAAAAEDKIAEKLYKGYREVSVRRSGPEQESRRPHIPIQPTIVAYQSPRREGKQAAAASSAIIEAAIRLAQSSGISVSEAMDLIERAGRQNLSVAAAAAAGKNLSKLAKPAARPKRKITLEEE